MQPISLKKKYKIDEYRSEDRANPIIQTFNTENQVLICICKNISEQGQCCFICKRFVHKCLAEKPNRDIGYECESCLNKHLDPMFTVKKVLNETYFRTHSIFTYINTINFQFTLNHEDLGHLVEVRGIIPGNTILNWPMQGGFSINEEKNNFHELKPLIVNSNRKSRREEYFSIPADKLVLGKNYLRFKIPCLNKIKFSSSYQYQEKKLYFFAVNLVSKLSPAELQTQTFRQRRTQKIESLKILQMNNSDVEITSNKVCLICPYTRDRIKVPIRGKYCKHFSCICLQTLISIHSSSRYWSCPLCDQRINQPYVDVWIYNMLIDNNKGSDVLVKEDGTYEWIGNDEDNMVNLDSDESSESPFKNNLQKMEIEPPVKKQIQKERVDTIIDIQDDDNVNEISRNTQKIGEQISIQKNKNITDKRSQKCKTQPKLIQLAHKPEKDDQGNLQKRRNLFSKMKQKVNSKLSLTSHIVENNNFCDLNQGDLNISSEDKVSKMNRSSTQVIKRADNKQAFSLKINEQKERERDKPVIYDIKVLQTRQIKLEQFKKIFFKNKLNIYKKHSNCQQLRRLFKQIL